MHSKNVKGGFVSVPVIKKETSVLKNYINGEWVDSLSLNSLDVINPATGETIVRVPVLQKKM